MVSVGEHPPPLLHITKSQQAVIIDRTELGSDYFSGAEVNQELDTRVAVGR